MNSILGIDIGSHSVKLIEIAPDPGMPRLLSAGALPTPPKSLSSDIDADLKAAGSVVKQLVKVTGAYSRKVNVSFPESLVFTRVIDVPPLSDRELASAIKWESEQYIPLPLDQVNIDYTKLRDAKETSNGQMEVLLVACPKILIDKYIKIIDYAGLEIVGAETEIIAASRALVRSAANVQNCMVVSIGAQTTDFCILKQGVIAYTRSISAGGEALSRALVQNLDFNQNQAEEYKKTYGVERDKLQGKILQSIKPILDTIVNELKRAVVFYQEKNKTSGIDVILLSGGTAKLPGLVMYVAEEMGIESQVGNPWFNIQKDARFSVLDNEGPTFSVAVGLALR